MENPMNRGSWWATVQGVSKSWTWLSKHTKFQISIECGGKQIGHVRLGASEAIHTAVVQLPSHVWHLDPGSKQRHPISTTPRSPAGPPFLGILLLLGVRWEMDYLSPRVDYGHLGRHLSKWGAEYIPEGIISCRLKKTKVTYKTDTICTIGRWR